MKEVLISIYSHLGTEGRKSDKKTEGRKSDKKTEGRKSDKKTEACTQLVIYE
ncbi:hypothetical protein CHS0354_016461, partial [Potamilus streckersoni]